MGTELRCIHRHTIKEHPRCFTKGLVKQNLKPQAIEIDNSEPEPWYQKDGVRIGYLDIESDGLKTDFATMLTWAIKEKGGLVRSDAILKRELFEGQYDKRIVQSCINEMKKYDIICTYFGSRFDIPFLRTKALHYGIEFPGYIIEAHTTKTGTEIQRYVPELYHWDLFYTVKSKLNLSSKSLANACDYLGIKGKTPLDKEIWRQAKYGEPKAIKKVLYHNTQDVIILEKLHDKIEFTKKWIKTGV